MSRAQGYAQALYHLMRHVSDTGKKLVQDRSLHAQNVANALAEAREHDAPAPVVDAIAAVLRARTRNNERKMLIDSMELARHGEKLKARMGPLFAAVIKHGASAAEADGDAAALAALEYAVTRSAQLLQSMYAKLAHDRRVQLQELEQLHADAAQLDAGALAAMLGTMIADRILYNERKAVLDTAQLTALQNELYGAGVAGHAAAAVVSALLRRRV